MKKSTVGSVVQLTVSLKNSGIKVTARGGKRQNKRESYTGYCFSELHNRNAGPLEREN
jgi:hypothetical protein